ncbi:MAG: ParA family protein [Candidatus Promineifilaceae bacterium]
MAGKVYTVENRKGGVAKTTTAVTLACGLAQRLQASGGRVLLVDLDAQGDAARALGLNAGGRCISYVLTGEGTLKDNVLSADRSADGGPSRPNLYVLPASDNLRGAKETLLSQLTVNMVMAQIRGRGGNGSDAVPMVQILDERLGPAREVFDYIILDCPPTLDMLQEAVHQFADAAIVPVKADFHSTSAAGRHTRNILDDQASGITIAIKAIVPTFVDKRLRLTRSMLQQLTKTYGSLVTTPIPNTVRVAEAPASGGLTVIEYAPESPASDAYWHLVDVIYNGSGG